MLCPKCRLETFIDHVNTRVMEDGTQQQTIAYVCLNPQCADYRRGFTAGGEEAETHIKEKE